MLLQRTRIAIGLAGPVVKRGAVEYPPRCRQGLTIRADIDVTLLVIVELGTIVDAIRCHFALILHRNI